MGNDNQQGTKPPGILSAIPLVGQVFNAVAQGVQNRAQRKWNEKMYGIQREDALADWARNNEYNSPLQQMARLREAGLNPHLVYGGGANSVSQPVRSTDVKTWNPQAPAFNFGQIVDQYLQTKVAGQNIELMQANIKRVNADTEGKTIENLKNAKGLPFVEDQLRAKLQGQLIDNQYKSALTTLTLDRNQREELKNSKDLDYTTQKIIESQQRVIQSKEQVKNLQETNYILKQTGVIKKLEAMQRQMGLDDDYTQVEWFIAQAAYDPKGSVEIINKYIKALGWIAESGVKQTGTTIKNTAKAIWNVISGN